MKTLFRLFTALLLGLLLASCGRADRMRHLLEQAEWMNQNDSAFTSDSVGRTLVRYYDHWWHPADLRLRAYYMLGCAYRDLGNAPRALENYQLAAAQADTLTAPDSTLNRLMRVHSQMSQIYLQQRLPELEEQELQTAERLAWKTGDTLSALIFEEYLCNQLYNGKKYIQCANKAIKLSRRNESAGLKDRALQTYVLCVKSYLQTGNYFLAKKYLDLYERCSYLYNAQNKVNGGLGALYLLKGNYFLCIEELDSAKSYYRKALSYQSLWDNRLLVSKGMCQIYLQRHEADSLSKYTQLYSEAKEKSFNEAQTMATIQAKSLYDYSIEQTEAKAKTKANARLTFIILALIFAFAIAFLIFLYHQEKRKREISELRQKHQAVVNNLQQVEQTVMALRIAKSSDESRIADYAERTTQLKAQADHYQSIIKRIENKKSDLMLEKSHIVMRFKYSLTHFTPDDKLQEEHWAELKKLIEEQYPLFHQTVNGIQRLYENEYRICLLVKAGFSPIDIDLLMDKKHSYASNMRKRLHKKVYGYDGSASDFDKKIRNI